MMELPEELQVVQAAIELPEVQEMVRNWPRIISVFT